MCSKSTYSNDLNKNKAYTLKRPAWHGKKKNQRETLFLRPKGNPFPIWICDFDGLQASGPFPILRVFDITRVLIMREIIYADVLYEIESPI